jgi:serine O-acetyltransferase
MQAVLKFHHFSRRLYLRGFRLGARLVEGLIRLLFGASIPASTEIGRDVFFHHNGLGVVINGQSKIGDGCEIGVHVVLGGRAPLVGAPHLGKNVIVHAGAKIIGRIQIGEGSIVGANAVVLKDMPGGALIVGVPAEVKRTGVEQRLYRHDAVPG